MLLKDRTPNRKIKINHPVIALCLSLALGLGLLIVSLNLPGIATASGPKNVPNQEHPPIIGLASNALECLIVGDDLPNKTLGVVRLSWPGRAERARLMLSVSGTEAAHTIKINGRPVASTPIHPGGQPCRNGETFYLEIPPQVLAQGENLIELTNDASTEDSWSASQVRLEVLGDLTLSHLAATDVTSFTITFTNSYDGSSQEARVVQPDSYNGTPVPLMIYVHGRSVDMYRGEELFGQAIGNKGWLLASPQLHGSWTGDPQPDPPGKYAYASLESQYDVVGTLNYMLENYNVITDQIYLVGYSMGGQTIATTAAKYPHVFAAAFDNKGPTDMDQWYYENTSFHQTWMRRECHIGEIERDPTQNPFCYQRRSGLNFAGNYIHTPVSITHSISDTLVPITHSFNLRDAINSYNPDQLASVYIDTVVGPTCADSGRYHCYEPDPSAVLNFLESFGLNNNPTTLNITTDESKSYHWMNLAQTVGDHWSQVQVTYYPISDTVTAIISDTEPLTLALNLGSTDLPSTSVHDQLKQPGMGLRATTYLIKGGGNHRLEDYASGYLTTTLTATGQFSLTISALAASLSADPDLVSGWHTTTSTLTAEFQDQLGHSVPDGTTVRFSTTEGTFPNAGSVYTTTVTGGQATAILTLTPVASPAQIVARIQSVTGSTSIDAIYPDVDIRVTPSQVAVYNEQSVTYTYQITNTGDATLTDVRVLDDSGTVCQNITLTTETTHSCTRSSPALTETTAITATVTGQDPLGYAVTATDSTTVTVLARAIYLPVVIRSD